MPISGPLDVVSVADIKEELLIDFNDDDAVIERKIKAAISLIEQETVWRFYPRTEIMQASANTVQVFQYPLTSITAVNSDNDPLNFSRVDWPLRVTIDFDRYWGRSYDYVRR